MKRIMIPLVVFTALAFSCRKTRTCECDVTKVYTPANGGPVKTDQYSVKTSKEEQKKKEFRNSEKCFSRTITYTVESPTLVAGNYVEHYVCDIK